LGILIVTLLISWKGPSTLARIKMAKEELDIKIKNAAAAGTQPDNASSRDEGSAKNFCTDLSKSMYRMYLDVSVKRKGVVLLAVRCVPNKHISFCSLLLILRVPPPLLPSVCHIWLITVFYVLFGRLVIGLLWETLLRTLFELMGGSDTIRPKVFMVMLEIAFASVVIGMVVCVHLYVKDWASTVAPVSARAVSVSMTSASASTISESVTAEEGNGSSGITRGQGQDMSRSMEP
jgi:hypothetical protein